MKRLLHGLSLLALLGTASSDALPYNPTSILTAPNSTYAYIFQPSTRVPNQSQLLTLDFSKPLTTSQHPSLTVSETLPFLQDGELIPYTPAIDKDGNITVIAGNCSAGANGTDVWRFVPLAGSSIGNGTWAQAETSLQELGAESTVAGPNFLAGSIAFSEYVNGDATTTNIFMFGGMCPLANSSSDTWTSDALYSNQMVSLSPDSGSKDYGVTLATNRGPPIAEAGFSITALQATFSQDSSSAAQTQQQNFVLVGGHTQSAFINMSQVALYSLPQESWTFLPVNQPTGAKTDLTARQSQTQVEPRSGHTAVLSEDGKSIIVVGGWVGDIHTPAQPQLAVLNLGSGYGGTGAWSWTVPSQSANGPAAGTGMYGHGAVMLPGEVMMIVGGYSIPATSSKRIRRQTQAANSQLFLYNATSNSWIDSYTPPAGLAQQSEQDHNAGPLSQKSQQAGLGAGLGIGAAILVSLVVFYFWYTRRLSRARRDRERNLLSRSSDGSSGNMQQPFLEKGGIDGRGGDPAAMERLWNVWDHGSQTGQPHELQMEENAGTAGATGLFVDIPSPTRGLRKGTVGRNYQYHPAPRYDDKRLSRGSGNIHTITEHDEEDETGRPRISDERMLSDAERKLRELERVLNSPDPFLEAAPNPLGSHPVSPEMGAGETGSGVPVGAIQFASAAKKLAGLGQGGERNWTVEPGAGDVIARDHAARASPVSSDDRTSSTLSEQSQRSAGSSNSITRTMSTRTGAILAAAMAARSARDISRESSPTDERTQTMSSSGPKSPFYTGRARSSTNDSAQPHSASTDADSFTTARTDFAQLQLEGEALLGGRPTSTLDRDDPYQRALAAHSPTRTKVPVPTYEGDVSQSFPSRRRQGWMGSLRRALNAVSMSERSFSLTGTSEQYTDQERSSSTSPTKDKRGQARNAPRRAVSDGSTLLRQKQGQKDWDDKHWERYRDDPDPGDWGEPQLSAEKQHAEEDWDVEGAASKRDFQVMFTVPKARLRVVNADMDRASLRSASDGALSRTESVKNLRREESLKTLRARSDGDKSALPSTVEEKDELGWPLRDDDPASAAEKEKEKAA